MKLRLDWHQAWRWFSMQAMALDVAFLAAWATIPDDLKAYLPSWLMPSVAVVILVLGMIGRLIQQNPPGANSELGK